MITTPDFKPDFAAGCAVSVVIPAYRVTSYIADALDSVLAQTFRDFEVIVVNDACPDTAALDVVLKRYETRIVYLKHTTNAGPSAARNTGIRAARGSLIAFLDGDDVLEPEYLDVQLRMFQEHPEADMVYGSALIFGDDPSVGMPIEAFCPTEERVTTVSLLKGTVTVLLTSVIRREILFRAGLFDEHIRKCEDFDLWLRLTKLGGCIVHHAQPIARYRVRGDSASANSIEMVEALFAVAAKLEKQSELTGEETAALAEARRRWAAESDLEQAKLSFQAGSYAQAGVSFRKANAYYKRPKLYALTTVLTCAPGLVNLAMECRGAFSGTRTVARGTR